MCKGDSWLAIPQTEWTWTLRFWRVQQRPLVFISRGKFPVGGVHLAAVLGRLITFMVGSMAWQGGVCVNFVWGSEIKSYSLAWLILCLRCGPLWKEKGCKIFGSCSCYILLLGLGLLKPTGSCHKRQKPQAPTPQAPIRNHQTIKVANAKGLNRNTYLT